MKLGISSYTYGWAVGIEGHMPDDPLTFLDLIELAHKFGLSLLQVGDNLPLDRLSLDELEQGKAKLTEYGIQLELGIRGLTDAQLKQYLVLCQFFSARLLRVVIDDGAYRPSEEEIIKILKRWEPELARLQVVLGIENHDRLKVIQLVRILRHVDSPFVGICLDCANSLGALEGLETISDALIPYTVNLHAKDISVYRLPSQMGFQITGTASCEGMLDLQSLLNRVARNGKNATCILEQWTAFSNNLEQTLQKEREEAERGIHNLQKILRDITSTTQNPALYSQVLKTQNVCIQKFYKKNQACYRAHFFQESCTKEQFSSAGEQIRQQCNKMGIGIDQACADPIATLIASGQLFSAEGKKFTDIFFQTVRKISGCREIVIPLGKCELLSEETVTIGKIKQAEENYFWGLSEFVHMCQNQGFDVGIQLLPDSFVDNESILLQEITHHNISAFNIYQPIALE